MFDPEIITGFVVEVRDYLPALGRCHESADARREAHRHAHSITGSAAMLGLTALSKLAGLMESHLERAGDLTPEAIELAQFSSAGIDEYLQALSDGHPEATAGLDELAGMWMAMTPEPILTPPPEPRVEEPIVPEPEVDDSIPAELAEVFALESEDHLRTIHGTLPKLRAHPDDREALQEIRRSTHTLKGAAGMVGFREVTALAHRMEDLLDQLYDGHRTADGPTIDLLFRSADALEDLSARRPAPVHDLYAAYAELLQEPSVVMPAVVPAAVEELVEEPERKAERNLRVPIERLDDLVKVVSELVITRAEFEQRLGGFIRQVEELQLSTARLRRTAAKIESQTEARALVGGRLGNERAYGFDALEFDRYSELHLFTRELSETAGDLHVVGTELANISGDFDGYLGRQTRLTSELQDKLMRTRMVPVRTLAGRLERTARNAATLLGKQVRLVVEGGDTELDKTVLEEMAEPLLHLVRNAVDHGIESPDDRRALGKSAEGVIRVQAFPEGTQVVLRIRDDGRGVDLSKIRAKAIAQGLLTDAERVSDDDLYAFLFRPGFSTATQISEVSGRGVGLDIVRAMTYRMKGNLRLTSEPGLGTTFTIRLPLTLAILRALLVQAHGQTFAIPLAAVSQLLRQEPEMVATLGDKPVLQIAGKTYPHVALGKALALETPSEAPARPPIVVLNGNESVMALTVDRILGGREIVVKNLGSHLRHVPGIAGATLLGDGSVVLIVNPAELSESQRIVRTATPVIERRTMNVLVVDDSPSVRRVVTALLSSKGMKPTTAKDGVEALEILQRGERPDAILLDIEMPRMDGYELLSTLRADGNTARLPVIMVTSRAGDKHRGKAMTLGATAYLVKPYSDDILLETLRRVGEAGR